MNLRHTTLLSALAAALAWAAIRNDEAAEPVRQWPAAMPAAAPATAGAHDRQELPAAAPDATEPGTSLRHRFMATSTVVLGEQTVCIRLDGQVHTLVVDRRGSELLAQVQFPSARVSMAADAASQQYCSSLAAALALPVIIRMDAHGRTLGYRFAAGVIADHRNWVRTLVSAFRFVLDDSGAENWETTEADNTGLARVRYQRAASTGTSCEVTRARVAYPELPHAQAGGSSRASFGEAAPWPAHAQIDDELQLELAEAATTARGRFTAQLDLLAMTRTASRPAADWSSPWAPANGAGERSELAVEAIDRQWRERLVGVDCDSVLYRLTTILGAQPVSEAELQEQLELLAKLLELRPGTAAELARVVCSAESDPRLVQVVFCAAARAGTEAAQTLLLGCAEDAQLAVETRRSALEAMFALAAPSPAAVARIGAALDRAPAITAVEGTALLLLGSYADRSAEAPGFLLAAEARLQQQGMTPLWLESLGNAGTADTFAAARRYCDAPDEATRAAAMTALRKVEGTAAADILADKLARDSSPAVRRSAARALAEHRAAADDLFAAIAAGDADEGVRGTALLALHRRSGGSAQVKALLARRAIEDPAADLRHLAEQLLARTDGPRGNR